MHHRSESYAVDNDLKLVILGQGAVGKSSITLRFVNGEFDEDYNPTLQEIFRKAIVIDDKPITLEILDTAGQEEYEVMQENWIGQGKGFILVYSIDNEGSFQEIKKIKKRIDRIKNFGQVSAILVGNKCDLHNRVITYEQGQTLASELNMIFLETSAKTGSNCENTFTNLVRDIRRKEAPVTKKKDKSFMQKFLAACNLI